MKDSAWYRKIWGKKLAELPLKKDADTAWAGMKNMLDAQMPINSNNINPGKHIAAKSVATKVVALLVYVLPAAAMIGTAVYFTVPALIKQERPHLKKKQTDYLPIDTGSTNPLVSVRPDSINSKNPDSIKNDSLLKVPAIGQITVNGKTEEQTTDPQTSSKGPVNVWTANLKKNAGKPVTGKIIVHSFSRNTSVIPYKNLISGMGSAHTLTVQSSPLLQRDNIILLQLFSVKQKSVANKFLKTKTQKNKTKKPNSTELITPLFDYGIEAGLNKGNTSGLYVGVFGTYRLKTRWLLNAGLRIISSEALSGSYTAPAVYYFPDSLQPFKVTDKRKLLVLNIPLTIEYRISNLISLNLGPVISLPVRQSSKSYQLGPLINQMDTISSKSLSVDTVLKRTIMNKINMGVTGGVSIHFSQFYFDIRYQQSITPYKVSSDFGSYQQYNRSLQLGIRYKFKK